jgi:glycosyltransferase involved in cell wall biosynthesis
MMLSKRIILISNYQKGIGGINAQVDLLQSYLQLDGWQADIFSTKGNPLRRCIAFLKLLCQARRYDILHIHACSYWGMVPAVFGILVGKLWRKRIVITYHGGEAAEYFAKHIVFVKRWLGRADEVIVLSGFLKEIFDHYDIPCVVIPNIVVLQPQRKRTRDIAPRFISIRHLEPLYNIPCILQAYEQVLKVYPNATLDILGKGSMREQLEQYVVDKKMTGVQFIGQVPNLQIYEYLDKADIMLSASRADNMPVSLLEAMNAGLLVLASRVGGIPYMIEEGKTGLLFENENANELIAKMLWSLEHHEEVLQIIANAQTEVQKYSWNNVKQQLIKVYKNE